MKSAEQVSFCDAAFVLKGPSLVSRLVSDLCVLELTKSFLRHTADHTGIGYLALLVAEVEEHPHKANLTRSSLLRPSPAPLLLL
jgi:hypothetical protein